MPHIPAPGLAPTFSRPHDVVGTMPPRKGTARKVAAPPLATASTSPLQLGTISLRKHTVDPKDVAKVLFGKEPDYDERTKQLVYPRST